MRVVRLGLSTLRRGRCRGPAYDPGSVGIGHVHLGLGAFHKAHQAVYSDDALAEEGGNWGIAGLSLRSATTRDALRPQDGLYTVIERGNDGSAARVIGAVRRAIFVPDALGETLDLFAAPATRVVTLTVTEKGYGHDPVSGHLDTANADIAHDLARPEAPRSAIGLLVAGLAHRRAKGGGALAVVSCDNMTDNGAMLRRLAMEFAAERDPALVSWIASTVAFPSTMVDRIVPAATEQTRRDAEQLSGLEDCAAVECEPFRQWVIEDRFPGGRPVWEAGGAEFVEAIGPYQQLKLRMLNGPHSAIAYLGQMLDLETVSDAMADDDVGRFTQRMMGEIAPTLALGGQYDVQGYAQTLRTRFRNPAIRHRTEQIAMDGSQKVPVRWRATLRDQLRAGTPSSTIEVALAVWLEHWRGRSESGRTLHHADPMAGEMTRRHHAYGDNTRGLAESYLSDQSIRDALGTEELVERIGSHIDAIRSTGLRRLLEQTVRTP